MKLTNKILITTKKMTQSFFSVNIELKKNAPTEVI